ncbi:hypothetical protein [Flavobacterium sp. KACC 22761]|uniref:hypothetical protein n=1 Tax=Flavobacterium sp. KACC 22761 TaxID=3092665 RepID=UPI002A759A49|nr:hypothetical protein [Flavobacterium sp. KACC 22761]WPO79129.1 hypothetical protein SCB73_01805 [Flavobacterium sp. KACC 22761]
MKKNFVILLLLLGIKVFAQNEYESFDDPIYTETFGKCFTELKPLQEVKNRVKLNKIAFCSLYQCVRYVQYVEYEEKMQNAILKRAVEIAALLYKNGTPIYLISGMNSSDKALIKNANLNDDNKLIYISVAECISSSTLDRMQEIVNSETSRLIKSKK